MVQQNNQEIGYIYSYYEGVAKIYGLPHVFVHEVLNWEDGRPAALVVGFNEYFVEAVFFESDVDLSKKIFRSKKIFSIKLSDQYIGRIINGVGLPIDNLGPISGAITSSVFRESPGIIDRQPVNVPLETGIKVIDTTLPIGRGQRELIIGDRKLGKTTIGLDAIINQKNAKRPVYCVYVFCGQKEQKLREAEKILQENGALDFTTIVAAPSSDSLASQYLAPFVGCTIAEYFRDRGKDALIVYDDLTSHAKVYREISLLLERPPGREAYPGDIFSLHAALLERACKLSDDSGGGSLTALPIVETLEGDITSFIPTNLISITDGQIYLERNLFEKGILPAVNIGLSVSRVGAQAQSPVLKEVTGKLRLNLSQYREIEKLSRLETTISEKTKIKLHRGRLLIKLLTQKKHKLVSSAEDVVLFYAVQEGFFDEIRESEWTYCENLFLEILREKNVFILEKIKKGIFDKQIKDKIRDISNDIKSRIGKYEKLS